MQEPSQQIAIVGQSRRGGIAAAMALIAAASGVEIMPQRQAPLAPMLKMDLDLGPDPIDHGPYEFSRLYRGTPQRRSGNKSAKAKRKASRASRKRNRR